MTRDVGGPQGPRRGDVVAVHEDGAGWGREERGDPDFWAVLRMPGVSAYEASSFLARYRVPPDSGAVAPHRAFGLDLDRLPADPSALTYAHLDAARVVREPARDPSVLGTDPRVIG
jgi:hypothetical protein